MGIYKDRENFYIVVEASTVTVVITEKQIISTVKKIPRTININKISNGEDNRREQIAMRTQSRNWTPPTHQSSCTFNNMSHAKTFGMTTKHL